MYYERLKSLSLIIVLLQVISNNFKGINIHCKKLIMINTFCVHFLFSNLKLSSVASQQKPIFAPKIQLSDGNSIPVLGLGTSRVILWILKSSIL